MTVTHDPAPHSGRWPLLASLGGGSSLAAALYQGCEQEVPHTAVAPMFLNKGVSGLRAGTCLLEVGCQLSPVGFSAGKHLCVWASQKLQVISGEFRACHGEQEEGPETLP